MPNPRLPLNTLPAFRAVARLQNLRAAAETLHLTHSAVSQQIKHLEEQIGVPLFERRGRKLALNAAGAALLRSVDLALDQLDEGLRAATSAAGGPPQRLRITLTPSLGQRWLLPRMTRWRERHPDIAIELHSTQQVVDLQREGYHVALRQGAGGWRGLLSQRLIDSALIVVGSPQAAERLLDAGPAALADQPLLGSPRIWQEWFELNGVNVKAHPVAAFNDAGLMLQAVEQDLGIALARELLAADALRDGRLVHLFPTAMPDPNGHTLWLVHPPALSGWAPLEALRAWLIDELERSRSELRPWRGRAAAAPPPG